MASHVATDKNGLKCKILIKNLKSQHRTYDNVIKAMAQELGVDKDWINQKKRN